ncbi:MAG: hypothetical protein PHZ04_04755 [Patescibacteria group bacterium]|nr:hypothetical protein [Patescibacteria group bacterium]MDD5294579.1 hypothetical protein [Patescibacteria group bacterium]MDD5554296.1 hypothetical protein [Patescibacteria group bacterium]
MFTKYKGYFKVVDLLSVLTFIFLWLKSNGYFDGQASTITLVVFWTCLREYVSVNGAERQLKIPRKGRNGGWWVIIWYLFAVLIVVFNFLNPDKYNIPASELIAGLTFVTEEYIRSIKLRKMQISGNAVSSPSADAIVISISPSIFIQLFHKE